MRKWVGNGLLVLSVALAACSVAPEALEQASRSSVDVGATCTLPVGERTFDQLKGPFSALQSECAPAWTPQQLASGFAAIRDTRMLAGASPAGFQRRIPWLLADNGCEERAGAAGYYFHEWGYPTPYYARVHAKLGKSLVFATPNDPAGVVKWSWHVAAAVRVEGSLMVMDPAIDPSKPLPIASWLGLLAPSMDDFDVALCRDYPVGDSCFAASPLEPPPPEMGAPPAEGVMQTRLRIEWALQEILGRDPERWLGDCPPWSCSRPEPPVDPNRAPTLTRVSTTSPYDEGVYAHSPFFILGNNFVEGVSVVRIQGDSTDVTVTATGTLPRRIEITNDLEAGDYTITVANGAAVSAPMRVTLQ